MSLLFDIAPDEPESAKRGRRKPEPTSAPAAAFAPVVQRPAATSPVTFLGAADFDDLLCADERCGATAHDVIDEQGRSWLVACAFCGTGQWVQARGRARQDEGEVFRFSSGRFSGFSIEETAGMENGREYIECAAGSHKHQAAREACQRWLAENGRPQ